MDITHTQKHTPTHTQKRTYMDTYTELTLNDVDVNSHSHKSLARIAPFASTRLRWLVRNGVRIDLHCRSPSLPLFLSLSLYLSHIHTTPAASLEYLKLSKATSIKQPSSTLATHTYTDARKSE